ncbi:ArsR/SmtB family transcription factor [Leifsonia sp. Leaf264]|uniref:ArsR/SmtB family transcription factor n=1 Tax=Leifsonia sp. Leaf264 TaxID=1736314 RepID=UPI0009E883CF|nr:metalloregulator ArsR/SmtB family transcription factor [Leifsonia sp. Leaf264]
MSTTNAAHTLDDQRLTQVFSALADPTRRDIVMRLSDGDATVGELAEPYAVSVQAVSKHLRVLEDAGLVSRDGDGFRSRRHLEAEVFDMMTAWIEKYRRTAEGRFRRLDAVLAEMGEAEAAADAASSSPTDATAVPAASVTRDPGGTSPATRTITTPANTDK